MKKFLSKLFIAFVYACVVLAVAVAFCLLIVPYLIALLTVKFDDES